jgi:hypothetical protein
MTLCAYRSWSILRQTAACAFLLTSYLGGQSLWLNESNARVLRQCVLEPSGLTQMRAEELGRQFLNGDASKKALAELELATNDFDLSKLVFHGAHVGGEVYDYSNALAELKNGYPFRGPVARVLKFRDWAVLAYRADASTFFETQLTGIPEKTELKSGPSTYHLLEFELSGNGYSSLQLFFRSPAGISVRDAALLSQALLDELDPGMLSADFRTDAWFLEAHRFPLLFPFSRDISVPRSYQYLSRPALSCVAGLGRPVACSGHNFRP